MGLYDYYIPKPPITCPKCQRTLDGWQGKHGPCMLRTFIQGVHDDELPETFRIDTTCCGTHFLVTCKTVDHTWTESTVETFENETTSPVEILRAKLIPPT